jgi:hypothetical protein
MVVGFKGVDAQNFCFDGPRINHSGLGWICVKGVLSPKLYIKLDRPPDG